ncbi:MAG: hypothetical protein HYY18_04750 [Planctomycetes bacterium]|nr:hypothetical protein [Planctomycetota bacterium]
MRGIITLVLVVALTAIVAPGCNRGARRPQPQPQPGNPGPKAADPPPKRLDIAIDTQQKAEVKLEHLSWVVSLSWAPGGKYFASGSWDGKVLLWDPKMHSVTHRLEWRGMGKVMAVAASDDLVAAACTALDVRLWRTDGTTVHQLPVRSAINSVAFSPQGMLAAAAEGGLHVWPDPIRGGPKVTAGACLSVAFSPDGSRLACGFRDGGILIQKTEDASFERKLQGDVNLLKSLAFSPDSNMLAASGNGPAVLLFTLEPPSRRELKDRGMGWIDAVAFTPDGKYVVSVARDHHVRFWDVSTGGLAANLTHLGGAMAVAADPMGKCVVSGGPRDVQFWQVNCPPKSKTGVVVNSKIRDPKTGEGDEDPETIEGALGLARKRIDEGDGDGAMRALDDVLVKYPRNLELLRYRLFVCERRLALRDAYDTALAIAAAEGDPLSDRERAGLVDKYCEMYLEEARRAADSLYTKKADVLAMLDAALSLKPGTELERRIQEFRGKVEARRDR